MLTQARDFFLSHILSIKYVNLFLMLLSLSWLCREPDWEPLLAFFATLSTFVATDFVQNQTREPESKTDSSPQPQSRVSDKKLFANFLELLPSNGTIRFVKELAPESPFDLKWLDPLDEFIDEWNNPEHEFFDSELDSARKDLLENADRYKQAIGEHTFYTNSGLQSVPREWRIEQPERFKEVIELLHDLAHQLVDSHKKFVRNSRKKLEC